MKHTDLVNVFQGCGPIKPAPPEDIAAGWHFIKGLSGNTFPGAMLPFGKLSAGCYSGGYPTGYGDNMINYGDPIRALYGEKRVIGVSHIHHDGTGGIGYYYNYAVASALKELAPPAALPITDESARPGYYTASDNRGVRFEVTVSMSAAYHRWTLPEKMLLSMDLSNDGLYEPFLRKEAGEAELTVLDEHTVSAMVMLQGIPLYFCIHCTGGDASLWEDHMALPVQSLQTNGKDGRKFGCIFTADEKTELCLTISAKSPEKALADNIAAREKSFDSVTAEAEAAWEEVLSAIEITAGEEGKEIFYSNFYHTLTKPSDWSGESFCYDEEDFLTGFSTLWDIYKTQLPLVMTLYPGISRKIVRTYQLLGEHIGVMPNAFGLRKDLMTEANQARLLAAYLFCDAYCRGIEADYEAVFRALDEELKSDHYRVFFETGEAERTTHTLDLAEGCGNAAAIAAELGLDDIVRHLTPYAENWRAAFDNEGLLKDGYEYYEGNRWNYSFRPLRKMNERIALCGEEKFLALLDRFFAFTDREDVSARFEGFNNETDMEAPYAYAYTTRHDRLCEIIDRGHRCMFTAGEGGIPGNNDSGGLSSLYIWNALGIFPVSGQDLMLIGTPCFEKAVLHLPDGKDFVILRKGEGIYVKKARLDGEPLKELRFTVRRMMQGGTLEISMTERSEENG